MGGFLERARQAIDDFGAKTTSECVFILDKLCADVERETLERAAQIAENNGPEECDCAIKIRATSIQVPAKADQDDVPPERKPSALRPEEDGEDVKASNQVGDSTRTPAPLGTSIASKVCPVCCASHNETSRECGFCLANDLSCRTQTVLQPWVPKTVYVLREDLKRAYDKLDLGESTAVAIYLYPHRDTVPDLEKFERTEEAPAVTEEAKTIAERLAWMCRGGDDGYNEETNEMLFRAAELLNPEVKGRYDGKPPWRKKVSRPAGDK